MKNITNKIKNAICDVINNTLHSVSTGFTLLELLVVVLIIGILASIALPQYRKAVGKAELSKVINVTKVLQNAQERFYLAQGEYASSITNLDINLPSSNISCVVNNIYSMCYDKSYLMAHYYSQRTTNSNRLECYAKDARMIFACEEFLKMSGFSTTNSPCDKLGVNPCWVVFSDEFPM